MRLLKNPFSIILNLFKNLATKDGEKEGADIMKKFFSLSRVYSLLEPGPVVMVTTSR
jgi:hypothetical protein